MSTHTMTIDGKAITAAASFDVIDPATGEVFDTAPCCTPRNLDDAMAAAAAAAPGWAQDEPARRDAIRACAEVLQQRAADLACTLTREQGKPPKQARYEFTAAATWLRYYANLALIRETVQDDPSTRVEIVRKPLGVVAAITPWNFPILLAVWKLAPALLAGNCVVLKPSPYTPLATLGMGDALREVLPPGVLNVVSGGNELGAQMVAHPVPRKVSFTGSVATGRKVAESAATDLKRVTLELGGNDAAIVLDDADSDTVIDGLFWGAFMNSGQACSAIKRLYVPARRVDEFVDALADRARTVRLGAGTDRASQLGPVNNAAQHARVRDLVADAVTHGARTASGAAPDRGYFHPLTIVSGIEDGVRIVDEEQFGPALPIIGYRDLDDALVRANASHYGLSGSVWSADPDRAALLAERLECGTAWVNSHLVLAPNVPFGGAKHSGIGVENGPWGLHEFTRIQVLSRAHPTQS